MPTGTIKYYNPDRGFGFIRPDASKPNNVLGYTDSDQDVFFHFTQWLEEDEPACDVRVGYELGPSKAQSTKEDPSKQMAVRLRHV